MGGIDCGAELRTAVCRNVDDWLVGERMGNRRLGRHCSVDGRAGTADRAGGGRHDEWLWHVQRAGHELLATAIGHGAGWHAAESVWQAASEIARALGRDSGAGGRLGPGSESGLRTAGDARHHDLRGEPDAGIRGADLPADSRAGIEASVPCSRRAVWSDCGRHSSDSAVGICHHSQRT